MDFLDESFRLCEWGEVNTHRKDIVFKIWTDTLLVMPSKKNVYGWKHWGKKKKKKKMFSFNIMEQKSAW